MEAVRLCPRSYALKMWSNGEIEVMMTDDFHHWARECLVGGWKVRMTMKDGAFIDCEDIADAMMAAMAWGD